MEAGGVPSVVRLLSRPRSRPALASPSQLAPTPSSPAEPDASESASGSAGGGRPSPSKNEKRVVYRARFPTSTDEMADDPTYRLYDTLFVVSSTDELGRRQITDTIRKELKRTLAPLNIACTKTSSFSCETRKRTRDGTSMTGPAAHKCLQMTIFCRREQADLVRQLLSKLIESRKSRKYFTCTRDGTTKPGIPIFYSEFEAKDPVYLHEENTVRTAPASRPPPPVPGV
ncbi:F-UL3 protein [Chelonid alphaherpesvirus 5]|uniref:F-UL3 protein n=1 Tax=Chelonid alphaherpesvirus 5 TaxID=702736 RepID=V5NWH2_9ALPH|nr:F-UL3 protein [Chelonid alphaherpesvirus 5]AHA93321.1 F-UL3 protein [Chelonid alphaherpesvirus 5]